MADEDFKDLTRRAACNKIMHDKAFNIAKNSVNITKNSKYDVYQSSLVLMVYTFLIKRLLVVRHAK